MSIVQVGSPSLEALRAQLQGGAAVLATDEHGGTVPPAVAARDFRLAPCSTDNLGALWQLPALPGGSQQQQQQQLMEQRPLEYLLVNEQRLPEDHASGTVVQAIATPVATGSGGTDGDGVSVPVRCVAVDQLPACGCHCHNLQVLQPHRVTLHDTTTRHLCLLSCMYGAQPLPSMPYCSTTAVLPPGVLHLSWLFNVSPDITLLCKSAMATQTLSKR